MALVGPIARRVEKRARAICILSRVVHNLWPRPPPRWANWLRGVRTRGLRAGLVGGPRPFLFCSQVPKTPVALKTVAVPTGNLRGCCCTIGLPALSRLYPCRTTVKSRSDSVSENQESLVRIKALPEATRMIGKRVQRRPD